MCPFLELKSAVEVCPWLGSLARRVLAIPATSAAPERLFSASGNTMTKKRARLTCDNLEELVFLHETWPVVREWEATGVGEVGVGRSSLRLARDVGLGLGRRSPPPGWRGGCRGRVRTVPCTVKDSARAGLTGESASGNGLLWS